MSQKRKMMIIIERNETPFHKYQIFINLTCKRHTKRGGKNNNLELKLPKLNFKNNINNLYYQYHYKHLSLSLSGIEAFCPLCCFDCFKSMKSFLFGFPFSIKFQFRLLFPLSLLSLKFLFGSPQFEIHLL